MERLKLAAVLLVGSAAGAQDVNDLLARGPVVSVETNKDGKFDKATAVIQINRSPDEVWAVATDFEHYRDFLPKVVASDTLRTKPGMKATQVEVSYEIEVPGANTVYTFRYDVDAANKTMKGAWRRGDIKDSFCEWRIAPHPSGSLLYYTTASRNFSSLAESIEDEQQTVTVGVNVAAALATVKAVKKRAEAPATAPAKAP
jgi:ribosome-associated toxin RatA of RatAB toxin-antitoxin module